MGAFVESLQRKLAAHAAPASAAGPGASGVLTGLASKSVMDLTAAAGVGAGGIADDMPFELRVLEVALDSVRLSN